MTMEVVWEEPPPKTTGKYGAWFAEFVAILKDNPNEWGRLPFMEGETSYSNTVQTTLRKNYPQCEWAARPIPNLPNRITVWGRFVVVQPDHPSGDGLRSVGRMERVNALAQAKNGK